MPHSHLKYQLFAELLSLLEKERFIFGVDRHLKLQELWAKLPEDIPVAKLKEVLCPAIATNEQQQALFYELFDEAWERVQAINEKEEASEDPISPPSGLPWIIGTSILLLSLLSLFLWPYIFPVPPVPSDIVREFSVPQGDTVTVAPIDVQVSTWGSVRESYFCWDSITKNTRASSVFGQYKLVPDSLKYLEYIAGDSLGQDSICVTMIDSAGLSHQVIFKARITSKQTQTPEKKDTTVIDPPTVQEPLFTAKQLPEFDEEILLPPTPLEQFLAKNIQWLRWVFIVLILLLLGFILRYLEQRRRTLVAQLESQDKPPYVWNIELDTAQDILVSEGFERMVNALRQRTHEDHFQIDIPKTVSATIDQAGMPTLAYRQQTRPPEYLMLIDRQSGANHRSKLFDWIYQGLLEQEVFVERYFFDGDIRTCFNEKQEHGVSITELQYLHPNARLLVFSHGYQFLSSRGGKMAKWTQIFDQWKQKTLFSSRPTQQWGRRESRLIDQFVLLPASMEGLQFFAQEAEDLSELPVNAWQEVVTDAYAQPITLAGGLISSLRQYYSEEMLQWIACCAVYPALHWDLTLFMGRQLSTDDAPLLTIDHLNSLTRLPWFVEGRIPEESRAVLVDYLEKEHPAILQKARLGLLTILQENPPPEDSNAWDDYQMQLSLNEWLSTKDAKRKKELEKQIADLLDQGVEADFVTLKYLEEPGPLNFIVPQQWKKHFYRSGYSGLGMRRWLTDLWWALPKSKRWIWLALTLVGCIGLILIGSLKWSSIDFVLEGRTSYLAFRLDKNWDFDQDIYLNEFLSFTVKSLELDTFQLSAPEGEPLEEIIFSGGQIKWQEIDLPANAVLDFDLVDGQLNSQAFVDSLRCLFALRNTNLEIPNQGFDQIIGSDSSLVLAEIILSEGPQMAFIPTQDSMFAFRLVPVSGLEFQRTDLEDDRGMQSEIIDGQVMTRGIDYDLKNKPYVDIIEPESTTLSFHQQGDYFKVSVEGKAKDLTIGAHPDTQESVKPTMIEHFGKSANANLIWNWIVGIVGLLGGIFSLWPKKS